MRKALLQSASSVITKCDKRYYKVRQVLQSATSVITKCDSTPWILKISYSPFSSLSLSMFTWCSNSRSSFCSYTRCTSINGEVNLFAQTTGLISCRGLFGGLNIKRDTKEYHPTKYLPCDFGKHIHVCMYACMYVCIYIYSTRSQKCDYHFP